MFFLKSESSKTVLLAACENNKTQFFWQIMFRGEIPLSYNAMPVTYKIGSQTKREEEWAIGNNRQLILPKDKDKFLSSLSGEKQFAIATPVTETEIFDFTCVDAVVKSRIVPVREPLMKPLMIGDNLIHRNYAKPLLALLKEVIHRLI